jgi:hypothetical protein
MRVCVAVAIAFLVGSGASATTISFVATDLPDAAPGEDLWQYAYEVSGRSFAAGEGFSIGFDFDLYAALENPPPQVSPDWDAITLQPDLNLPDFGIYDALALVDAPALSQSFTVTFAWLGTGTPGAQPFGIYDATFATIETGLTVPEATPSLLLLAGLLGTAGFAKGGRREHNNCI